MCKTLLERLKPEYKAVLDEFRDACPFSVSDIEKGLEKTLFTVDIPFCVISSMDVIFNMRKNMNVRINDIWDMFEKA